MFQNTGGYSPIVVEGLPHLREIDDLKKHLEEADDRLVCLTFAAGWCEPCRTLLADYQEIIQSLPDVTFLLVDVDESSDIQVCFRVTMVPTLVLLRNWQILEVFVGCCPRRLRRRIGLYQDVNNENPRPTRTDLRRIYELIRDDTYMVTSVLQDDIQESEGEGDERLYDDDDDDDHDQPDAESFDTRNRAFSQTRSAWKRMADLSRGPQAIGITFATKPTTYPDKNWMIAETYLKARRNKIPTDTDEADRRDSGRSDNFPQRISRDDFYPPIPPLWEDEGWEDVEEDEMYSWRDTEWHKALYDEWREMSPTGAKDQRKGGKPFSAPPTMMSGSAPRGHSGTRSRTAPPRSILKQKSTPKPSAAYSETGGGPSVVWGGTESLLIPSNSSRAIPFDLEDRMYSRAEVINLLRRCQRVCTTRCLDDQMREMITDDAGKELREARRQRQLAAARNRMVRDMALKNPDELRRLAPAITITPRRTLVIAPRSGNKSGSSSTSASVATSLGVSPTESFKAEGAGMARRSVFQQPRQSFFAARNLRQSISVAVESVARSSLTDKSTSSEASSSRPAAVSFGENFSPSPSMQLLEGHTRATEDLDFPEPPKMKKEEKKEGTKGEKKEKQENRKSDQKTTDKLPSSEADDPRARPHSGATRDTLSLPPPYDPAGAARDSASESDRRAFRGSALRRTGHERNLSISKYKEKDVEENISSSSSGVSD